MQPRFVTVCYTVAARRITFLLLRSLGSVH
jgi:hypothetical protein